jgi:hypothetical protein
MRALQLLTLAIAFLVLGTGVSRAQFVVCPKEELQTVSQSVVNRGLYLLDGSGRCWQEVKNIGLTEGTLPTGSSGNVQQFPARAGASFAYLISQPKYQSGFVIKERVFRPADIIGSDGNLRPARNAVPYVLLKRAAVQSVCDRKDDLDNFRRSIYGGNVKVDVNAYNRYHAQPYNFVPATDEIRQFHFSYPVGSDCRGTNDLVNRSQYVLTGLFQQPSIPLVSWIVTFVTALDSVNSYYSKLLVQNRFVNGTETLLGSPDYTIVRFLGDAGVGTRSEITISDLQQQGATSTWQIDWK